MLRFEKRYRSDCLNDPCLSMRDAVEMSAIVVYVQVLDDKLKSDYFNDLRRDYGINKLDTIDEL